MLVLRLSMFPTFWELAKLEWLEWSRQGGRADINSCKAHSVLSAAAGRSRLVRVSRGWRRISRKDARQSLAYLLRGCAAIVSPQIRSKWRKGRNRQSSWKFVII